MNLCQILENAFLSKNYVKVYIFHFEQSGNPINDIQKQGMRVFIKQKRPAGQNYHDGDWRTEFGFINIPKSLNPSPEFQGKPRQPVFLVVGLWARVVKELNNQEFLNNQPYFLALATKAPPPRNRWTWESWSKVSGRKERRTE